MESQRSSETLRITRAHFPFTIQGETRTSSLICFALKVKILQRKEAISYLGLSLQCLDRVWEIIGGQSMFAKQVSLCTSGLSQNTYSLLPVGTVTDFSGNTVQSHFVCSTWLCWKRRGVTQSCHPHFCVLSNHLCTGEFSDHTLSMIQGFPYFNMSSVSILSGIQV